MKVVKKYVYNDNESEKELVKKFLEGDTQAFTPLFYRYKAIFFSNVKKWYPDSYKNDEIQDMSMEFLGRIAFKLHLYDPQKAQFSTWITNSMKNFIIEYWNRKGRKPLNIKYLEEIDYDFSVDEKITKKIENKAHRKLIRKMIGSLGIEDTRIFNEIFLKGRTQTEVAKEMEIKRSTFEYRVKRVKKRLEKFRPNDL